MTTAGKRQVEPAGAQRGREPQHGEAGIVALIERGEFKEAASAIDRLANPSTALKVARLQIDERTDSSVKVCTKVEALLHEKLTLAQRATCYEILGRVSMRSGRAEDGMKAMRKAIGLAAEAQSPVDEARLTVSHAEALLNWVAIEAAIEEIPRARRLCVAAGDRFALIVFHKVVAEIRAKQGLPVAARQSLHAAQALLSNWPNVWLQGRLAVTALGIEVTDSNYAAALDYAQEALHCAETCGTRDVLVPALGNLAHLMLLKGRLAEAKDAITKVHELMSVGGQTEIAFRDTELEIALAAGDLERAQELAEEIGGLLALRERGRSHHGLWHALTRVLLEFRLDHAAAALAIARDAVPLAEHTDRTLFERMQLLVAEGLGRTGQSPKGAAALAAAVTGNTDPTLDMIGERCRVTGTLTSQEDTGFALAQFDRAARIFAAIGHVTAESHVNRDLAQLLPAPLVAQSTTVAHDLPADVSPLAATAVSTRIAAMLEFGAHPFLLAAEALALARETGCVTYGAVVQSVGEGHGEQTILEYVAAGSAPGGDANSPMVRITVGRHRDRGYHLVACPRSTATARATLLSVEALIHHSTGIARARVNTREQAAFWPEKTTADELGLVCASERTSEIVRTVRRVAGSPLTVLISGETGVGKELFARAIHLASPRKERTFLPFNCTAVPREMLDSQLFGHRRGAFTGALEDGKGVIRAAAGGTLFLDEIGELSLEAQPKLLRFLESGEILPLGETIPIEVDVRVVAATNADLEKMVEEGRFREDLYYRLNVLPIHIPPLRERREEIPALVEHFLEKYGRELQKPMLRVAEDTLEYLLLYRWPGNVRQLANEIGRMVAFAEPAQVLQPSDLSKEITASRRTVPVQPSEALMPLDQTLATATEQLERAVIERALKVCAGRNDEAAKVLGLSRKGLYLKRQRLGI